MSESGELLATKIGTINGGVLTLGDLVFTVKYLGQNQIFDEMVRANLLEQAADSLGIKVASHELQEAADAFRDQNGLYMAIETQNWLTRRRMMLEDLETLVRLDILKKRVIERIADEEAIARYFSRHQGEYDRAEISIIVTENEDIAAELKRQIDDGEANFGDLARDYSIDESSRRKHGYLGSVYREDISSPIEAAVFSERETGIRGPIEDENRFYLVMVQQLKKGELDDEIREIIARTLYDNFLNEMSAKSNVEIYILPEVEIT